MQKELEYPLLIYVEDEVRENYLKSVTRGKKPANVVILDDNPLSIAMYMEEHPEINFDDSCDLSPAEMFKLKEMLKGIKPKGKSAQDLLNDVDKMWRTK
ncbi:MAG: hypothetical protein NT076_02470 [Candidatus Pacearchaeota archaeon]|nr:hypothetical protein [Candidatus Pacearchaeota archaeon]